MSSLALVPLGRPTKPTLAFIRKAVDQLRNDIAQTKADHRALFVAPYYRDNSMAFLFGFAELLVEQERLQKRISEIEVWLAEAD